MSGFRRWGPTLVAVLVCAVLALSVTWPVPARIDRSIVGFWLHPDCLSNHWLLEWVAGQVSSGGSILHNDRYYWPVGDAPVLAGNGSEGFLYLPFRRFAAWPLAANLYVLAVVFLDGLAGWCLARAAGASPWGAIVAAAGSSGTLYLARELSSGRFSQADTAWMLFFVAAWLRFLARPRPGTALLAAALLAITAFFYWYYAFFGVLAGGVLVLSRGRWPSRAEVRLFALFAVAFLVLVGPWAWVFASGWASIPGASETAEFPHPQAYVDMRRPGMPLSRAGLASPGQLVGMSAVVFALGAIGAALAIRSARGRGPLDAAVSRGLLATVALFAALSLGPFFPGSPYELVYGLAAPLRRFWWPSRHVALAAPLWAVLGALATDRLLGSRPRLRALFAVLTVVSAIPVMHLQGATGRAQFTTLSLPPGGYADLARLPDGVLVEPPISPELIVTQEHLAYQIFHGKPLLVGHAMWVDRVRPGAWDDFVAGNSFLAEMQRFEKGELEGEFRFEAADFEALRRDGMRWFALNRAYFLFPLAQLSRAYDALFDRLFGQPVARARGIAIWDAANWTGEARVAVPRWERRGVIPDPGPDLPLPGKRPASNVFDRETPGGTGA